MMQTRFHFLIALTGIVAFIQPRAIADSPASQNAEIPTAVQPFISDTTLAVARIDMNAIEVGEWLGAVKESYLQAIGGNLNDDSRDRIANHLDGAITHLDAHLKHMREAGIDRLYAIADLELMLTGASPLILVAPMTLDTQEEPARAALGMFALGEVAVMHNALVTSSAAALESLRTRESRNRPDLASALADGAGKPVRIAVALAPYARRAIEEWFPVMPPELGKGNVTDFTQGLRTITLTLGKEPLDLDLTIQAADAQMAGVLRDRLSAMILHHFQSHSQAIGDPAAAAQMLLPEQKGDQLALDLNRERVTLLAQRFVPALQKSHDRAQSMTSASNIRSMLMGITVYAQDNDNNFPPNLDILVEQKYIASEHLENPRTGFDGYVYLPPPVSFNRIDPQRMMMYESPRNAIATGANSETSGGWPEGGIWAGFADGHVELIADRTRFEELLTTARSKPQ